MNVLLVEDDAAVAKVFAAMLERGGFHVTTASTAAEALAMADADLIVVAGSLYLVGEVRGMITATAEEAG